MCGVSERSESIHQVNSASPRCFPPLHGSRAVLDLEHQPPMQAGAFSTMVKLPSHARSWAPCHRHARRQACPRHQPGPALEMRSAPTPAFMPMAIHGLGDIEVCLRLCRVWFSMTSRRRERQARHAGNTLHLGFVHDRVGLAPCCSRSRHTITAAGAHLDWHHGCGMPAQRDANAMHIVTAPGV